MKYLQNDINAKRDVFEFYKSSIIFFQISKSSHVRSITVIIFLAPEFPTKGPYLKFWHGTYPYPKKPSLFIFCFSKYHFWIPFPQKLTWVSFSSKRSFFGFPFGVSANLGWFRWDCRAPKFKSHMISVSLENRVPLLY